MLELESIINGFSIRYAAAPNFGIDSTDVFGWQRSDLGVSLCLRKSSGLKNDTIYDAEYHK